MAILRGRVVTIAIAAAVLVLAYISTIPGATEKLSFDFLGEGLIESVGGFLEDPEAAVFMVAIVLCLWLTIVILNAVLQQIVRGLFWTLSLVSGNHHVG